MAKIRVYTSEELKYLPKWKLQYSYSPVTKIELIKAGLEVNRYPEYTLYLDNENYKKFMESYYMNNTRTR